MIDFGIPIELELALGALLVIIGSNLLEGAAVGLACVLKRAYAVGAILLALSGNLPEFAVSASAILADRPDLAVSSIIGSVAVNILLVIGLSGLLGARRKDLEFDHKKLQADLPLLIGALGLFIFLGLGRSDGINVLDGVLLLLTYVLLLRFILYSHKEVYSSAEAHEKVEGTLAKFVGMFILAAAFVALGAEMLVSGVEEIFINQMHWDEKFVGFTILALAANLPEHLAAIRAAMKGRGELAIGNAIGSASQAIYLIFGLLIIISFLTGKVMPSHSDPIYIATFAVSVLLVNVIVSDGKLSWFEGWICLLTYILAAISIY